MRSLARPWSLSLALATLSACSGSTSSGGGATVALAVTDAATEQLSTFVIGLESVELVSASADPVSLLQRPTAVDFAALADLSRVLNVVSIPDGEYTGLAVTLLFDGNRVVLSGQTTPAGLLDAGTETALSGTMTITADFPAPLLASSGNFLLELDLDLNQSLDVDTGSNAVYLEPTLLPRVNPTVLKEHAIGGTLRTVSIANDSFRIGLESDPGDAPTVVTVSVASGTVCQVDGVCWIGANGLAALDELPANSWVQAFGTMNTSNNRFEAITVEAGTGSYNGGSDILDGVVTGINGTELTVRGHSNDFTHTEFKFNLVYAVTTDPNLTKVVERGSPEQYTTDRLNIGTHVRMFGQLGVNDVPHPFSVATAADVVRIEPSHLFGQVVSVQGNGDLEVQVLRVDLRDAGDFTWSEGGPTAADPDHLIVSDPNNFAPGQSITAGTVIEAVGLFSAFSDSGADFVAASLANRELTPSVLLIRDRANGLTVIPTVPSSGEIAFTFAGAPAGRETAVVDQGFLGQTDVTLPGISVVPVNGTLGLGLYTIRDRTLHTFSLYLTFVAFAQGLEDALNGGATLFNFSAVGVYDADVDEIASALAGVIVQ